MDIKIFFAYFFKYAYKKYLCVLVALLFLRYGFGVVFFNKEIIFSIMLALFIYDLPFYFNFKHWETNKIVIYRDLLEIFTSILSVLYKAYGYWKPITNVGYFIPEEIKENSEDLNNLALKKRDVDFNMVKLCYKDFQALQYIHAPFFEKYCCDDEQKDCFSLLTGNITKMERDVHLILNLTEQSQQLDCIDNFHLQVRNICNEINIFYSELFYEVGKNIPMTKDSYMAQIMRKD